MGLAGKILAVLNVLAAVVFLIVAGLDYSTRQAWALRVFQQEFVLRGLPVDENETNVEGRSLVKAMGKGMPGRLFANVGNPVTTQQQEVERRYQELRAQIDQAQDKRKAIEAILVPLARTWGVREEIRRQNPDELLKPDGLFEALFKSALHGGETSLDERRHAIAHLLFNLAKPEEQQRVVVVVGLESYVRAVEKQSAILAQMLPQLQRDMSDERTTFEGRHRVLLQEILAMHERVTAATDLFHKQSAVQQQHDLLVNQRKKDIEEMNHNIVVAQKATAEALALQTRMENELFETHQLIARTAEENLKLEGDIKNREGKAR
jgi:hypothetical protein